MAPSLLRLVLPWLALSASPSVGVPVVTNLRKFDFLPILSQAYFGPISAGPCNETLAVYDATWTGARAEKRALAGAIYDHQQCMLDEMKENIKATMASAGILLGLGPVLLQTAGPSIGELGLISAHRPLLSGLLALGTAATSPSRIFGYRLENTDMTDLVAPPSLLPWRMVKVLRNNQGLRMAVCVLQYVICAAAVFNVIYTSIQLGMFTINSFDCANSILPLGWALIPIIIHFPTSAMFWVSRRRVGKQRMDREGSRGLLRNEITLSVLQRPLPEQFFEPSLASSCLHWVASVMSFVHGVFGVLVFSSLLFVTIVDAVVILLRYLASLLACRAIIAFELSGMRAAKEYATLQSDSKEKVREVSPLKHEASTEARAA